MYVEGKVLRLANFCKLKFNGPFHGFHSHTVRIRCVIEIEIRHVVYDLVNFSLLTFFSAEKER